jgi:hypothetical protein
LRESTTELVPFLAPERFAAVPIHDWTRVDAGLFHAFHQSWIVKLCDSLNSGVLSADYFALTEQAVRGPGPDVLDLRRASNAEDAIYARRADCVTVRNRQGQVVAMVQVVSPGNKSSTNELRTIVKNAADLISEGICLLVIDLFPPSQCDRFGIHKAIWDEFAEEEFVLPRDKPLVVAAYEAGRPPTAYIEPTAVGQALPEMPFFLGPGSYVPAPLDATYQMAWIGFPAPLKRLLDIPIAEPPRDR